MNRRLGQGFEERVPLVLVLDTSASMARPADSPRIAELSRALATWLSDARANPAVCGSVEIALVTFGSAVQVLNPATGTPLAQPSADAAFVPIGRVAHPMLRPGGLTLMLPAIKVALQLGVGRARLLAAQGVPARRPRIWLVTDGAATSADGGKVTADELAETAALLRGAETPAVPGDGCLFYAIGTAGADRASLEVLAPESTLMLGSVRFGDVLSLVSNSTNTAHSSDEPAVAYREARFSAALVQRMRSLEERFLDQ